MAIFRKKKDDGTHPPASPPPEAGSKERSDAQVLEELVERGVKHSGTELGAWALRNLCEALEAVRARDGGRA